MRKIITILFLLPLFCGCSSHKNKKHHVVIHSDGMVTGDSVKRWKDAEYWSATTGNNPIAVGYHSLYPQKPLYSSRIRIGDGDNKHPKVYGIDIRNIDGYDSIIQDVRISMCCVLDLSPYVEPDTNTYHIEDVCSLISKIDTSGGFYYSQDGVNWYYNRYGSSNIPIGESYAYIYPRRTILLDSARQFALHGEIYTGVGVIDSGHSYSGYTPDEGIINSTGAAIGSGRIDVSKATDSNVHYKKKYLALYST